MKFCSLSSSSYANSVVVQDENTCIMIDCGLKKRDIKPFLHKMGLAPGDIDAVLVTHCHVDHTYGLNYLLAENNRIPIYSTTDVLRELNRNYHFKLSPRFETITENHTETINSVKITPLLLSHDVQTIGFLVTSGNERLGFLTDTGFVPDKCIETIQSVNYLYIEANHDIEMYQQSSKPIYVKKRNMGPQGHLSNDQCSEALQRIDLRGCRLVTLAHLSEDDNEPLKALQTIQNNISPDITVVTSPARTPGIWSNELFKKTS